MVAVDIATLLSHDWRASEILLLPPFLAHTMLSTLSCSCYRRRSIWMISNGGFFVLFPCILLHFLPLRTTKPTVVFGVVGTSLIQLAPLGNTSGELLPSAECGLPTLSFSLSLSLCVCVCVCVCVYLCVRVSILPVNIGLVFPSLTSLKIQNEQSKHLPFSPPKYVWRGSSTTRNMGWCSRGRSWSWRQLVEGLHFRVFCDSNSQQLTLLKANLTFFAVPWNQPGTICVVPLAQVGSVDPETPLISLEEGVTEFNFHPFNHQ